ncbi:uncharacterized protein LOC118200358 [Stegodyphus dumicola]|uniref:uncharacterized protein LOC118200358 n=1 Tax=Stegodyphus dumicola TaxID=202533 RepID=UPI0015B07D8C|nr:uncharacterized protein LOC118200358 [Stegodyphus dumicola]
MENCELASIFYLVLIICRLAVCHSEGNSFPVNGTVKSKSERKVMRREDFTPRISTYDVRQLPFHVSEKILNETNDSVDRRAQKSVIRRFDHDTFHDFIPSKSSAKSEGYWIIKPSVNYTKRNENVRKLDQGVSWPVWSSKKEIYNNNNKNRKYRKYSDSIDDYLGLDSKLHDFMSDRKYIHEHEGFIFPIHVPSHHEKDDNLIPLLLLLCYHYCYLPL